MYHTDVHNILVYLVTQMYNNNSVHCLILFITCENIYFSTRDKLTSCQDTYIWFDIKIYMVLYCLVI